MVDDSAGHTPAANRESTGGERVLEEQKAQRALLQIYLNQMGMLLRRCDLRNANENRNVSRMARARTMMVLGSVQTPKIRPFVSVDDRSLRGAFGTEDLPLWSF
jgi:hypothetical protein